MGGHLFIINGDLTKIACDALLVPTDGGSRMERQWRPLFKSKEDEIPKAWGNQRLEALRRVPKEPQPQASNGLTAAIWHRHGASWSQVSPAFGKDPWTLLALAQVPGTNSVWGVGAALVNSGANGLIAVDGPLPR